MKTPEERASAIFGSWLSGISVLITASDCPLELIRAIDFRDAGKSYLKSRIAQAIREAVEEEREACAKEADTDRGVGCEGCQIGIAIRERGKA